MSASAVVAYGLTLTLATDTFYFLAFPGLIGLAVVVIIAVSSVLRRSFTEAEVPYSTDGSDRRGAVRYHYTVLGKRYAAVAVAAVVCMALPLVAPVSFLFPLMGVGMVALATGTRFWLDQ